MKCQDHDQLSHVGIRQSNRPSLVTGILFCGCCSKRYTIPVHISLRAPIMGSQATSPTLPSPLRQALCSFTALVMATLRHALSRAFATSFMLLGFEDTPAGPTSAQTWHPRPSSVSGMAYPVLHHAHVIKHLAPYHKHQ
ncbi:hypothetical protein K491DRAFT_487574 [Lophiostoma macrostomum CBS 122681]|uniref:Uncharacterized protein n=1 Tax=Lophiostoma macrostomum CBS 122681 TaxID=1314788 RepID=A0A6A6T308_9PLEO|nr:hypothetical protein K491DRAFT_487574 [Lophiostoma macrostomum CBS 122681]